MAVSRASRKNENSLTFLWIDSHEGSSDSGVSTPVNTIRKRMMAAATRGEEVHNREGAYAVDAEVGGDAELRQPLAVLDELVVGAHRVERPPQVEGGGEREQRHAERDVAHQRLAPPVVRAGTR